MRWPWEKKQETAVAPPSEPEPRPLTGIEKWEIEQGELAEEKAKAQRLQREQKLREEIAAIESKIGPDMAKLNQLKAQLNPYAQYVGQLIPYPNFGNQQALSSLLGALGGGTGARGWRP